MTQTEALKLALEALEDFDYDKRMQAITAIKEALAQPEQEPEPCKTCNGTGEVETGIGMMMCDKCHGMAYTTPPKREWVGLTEEQFLEAARLAEDGNYLVAFQRIQQWLREGNT
jgi:RecJ-like exonuclease